MTIIAHVPTDPTTTGTAPVPIPADALVKLREKARLNAEVTTWKPGPGDTLEGVIVGSREVSGPFGPQKQAIIQTPGGAMVAVWLTAWLLGQLRARPPTVATW